MLRGWIVCGCNGWLGGSLLLLSSSSSLILTSTSGSIGLKGEVGLEGFFGVWMMVTGLCVQICKGCVLVYHPYQQMRMMKNWIKRSLSQILCVLQVLSVQKYYLSQLLIQQWIPSELLSHQERTVDSQLLQSHPSEVMQHSSMLVQLLQQHHPWTTLMQEFLFPQQSPGPSKVHQHLPSSFSLPPW